MQWTTVLAVAALAGAVLGDDECAPKPGDKHPMFGECCKVGEIPADLKKSFQKCLGTYPLPPKPTGPPAAGATPPDMSCLAECVFNSSSLYAADGKIDKEATKKAFSSPNADFTPVINAAVDKCSDTYKSDVASTDKCQSGALQMKDCVMKEVFLNCPSTGWTTSSECMALKTKVTKCPKMHVCLIKI